jgi:ABC-type branched-subunit amino acid transport system ATPase component
MADQADRKPVIVIPGSIKHYGEVLAVNDISFTVNRDQLCVH